MAWLPAFLRRTPLGRAARDLADALVASDPGFVRLALAGRTVASVLTALVATWLMTRAVAPGGLAAPSAASLRHAAGILAMMVAAVVAMVTASRLSDVGTRAQMATLVLAPLPAAAGLSPAWAPSSVHGVALALTPVVFGFAVYVRRFGPRGFVHGTLAFIGLFLGLLAGPRLTLADVGWLCGSAVVGAAAAFVVRFGLWPERRERTLRWTQRAFMAQGRRVLHTAIAMYAAGGGDRRGGRGLDRGLFNLNGIALIIDALLADSQALALSASPVRIQHQLFDLELAIQDLVHLSLGTASSTPPRTRRRWARRLDAVRHAPPEDSRVLAAAYAREVPSVPHGGRPEPWTDAIVRLVETAHAFTRVPGLSGPDEPARPGSPRNPVGRAALRQRVAAAQAAAMYGRRLVRYVE